MTTDAVGARVGVASLVAVAVVVVGVLVVAGLYAAGRPSPAMTADDARAFTERALAHAGVEGAVVGGRAGAVRQRTFRPGDGSGPVPVLVVPALVGGERIALHVARDRDAAVYLDDVSGAGDDLVLDDEQFAAIEGFRYDPAGERARGARVVAGTVAVLVAVSAAAALVLVVREPGGLISLRRP
ncbi:MAG TPA: hypothetical protein VMN58_03890 [Acidimicrobiales bacterium]|nr:hypothetical protein [Acidimicrobiales bacterium]